MMIRWDNLGRTPNSLTIFASLTDFTSLKARIYRRGRVDSLALMNCSSIRVVSPHKTYLAWGQMERKEKEEGRLSHFAEQNELSHTP